MKQKIIFDISKEYPLIASDEIIACLTAEGHHFQQIKSTDNAFIIQSTLSDNQIHHLAQRLSMTFSIGSLVFSSPPSINKIKQLATNHPIHLKGSIAIRYKNRSNDIDSQSFVHAVGDVYTQSNTVNLTNPDTIIFLLITDNNIYVSNQIATVNRGAFEERKAHLRPFFSPISLHPKIARVLVNLACVKPNDIIVDPFCGTGGILIEAGLMNMQVIGCDVSKAMIQGTQQNLKFYKINPKKMFTSDIKELPNQLSTTIDAVVTDFPYGKATSTQGEQLSSLYQRALSCIQTILKPGGRAVIGTSSEHLTQCNTTRLSHCISYPLRVHRSLTRWFHVFEKRP
jgi:tRNA (guanine10-N2)-dimethyltransferase